MDLFPWKLSLCFIVQKLQFCPIHEYVWLRGGDLKDFQVLKQEGVSVTLGTSPLFHLISYIDPYMNIYCLGVGISTVSMFSNRRGGVTTGTPNIFHFVYHIVTMHVYI